MANLSSDCLRQSHTIISIMGAHAGESPKKIFHRKMHDISCLGWTLWLIKSHKAKPDRVQAMGRQTSPLYVAFITSASRTGAQLAVTDDPAKQYSDDNETWMKLPPKLGPVTGHLGSGRSGAYALKLDQLELYARYVRKGEIEYIDNREDLEEIDLWDYSEFDEDIPGAGRSLDTRIGCSTVCAERVDTDTKRRGMNSRYRKVIACARLCAPYAVWVR